MDLRNSLWKGLFIAQQTYFFIVFPTIFLLGLAFLPDIKPLVPYKEESILIIAGAAILIGLPYMFITNSAPFNKGILTFTSIALISTFFSIFNLISPVINIHWLLWLQIISILQALLALIITVLIIAIHGQTMQFRHNKH